MSNPIIIWFRRDLRVSDHAALTAACESGRPVLPVYIHAPDEEKPWAPGGASHWWLHHSLAVLQKQLEKKKSRLIIRKGPVQDILMDVMKEAGADAVYWSRQYEPAALKRDTTVKQALKEQGFTAKSFNASLLFEPWSVENKSGKPFQVFTPFWKNCLNQDEPSEPLPPPKSIPSPKAWPDSLELDDLKLLPRINWDAGFYEEWTPGETGAQKQCGLFCDEIMAIYKEGRDIPGKRGTSRLSPHLHFGEISPRQIWHWAQQVVASSDEKGVVRGAEHFLREVGWREFAYHLLYHFPHTPDKALREEFNDFPWVEDSEGLRAWQKGMTGYPVVDAGMRELWHTGWMHNRVRMIVASFLVKDLLVAWQEGAAWFWDTLVDADLASNTLGWQWTAGCGADAAPYFRIFNPILQGIKFDGDGAYVRKWVPELAKLPDDYLHKPWEAGPLILKAADVKLGESYPEPIVDHGKARDRALEALSQIKKS